jgi:hypothetical protein
MFQTAFQANAFQNNAFQIYNLPPPSTKTGGDDAWITPEELKRIRRLKQKIAERQRKLDQAIRDANASRKQAFKDLIDPTPVAKVKKTKVQSIQKVKADIPSVNTEELQRSISYLQRQRDNILAAIAYRQKFARLQAEYMEAKRQEELDDEEAILFLM